MQIIRLRLVNGSEGCEKTPIELLKELKNIQVSEKGKIIEFETINLEEIHVDLKNLEEANWLILKNSEEAFYKNSKVFFIGGDGCISYSILKSFNKVEKNPLLIIFDSHADCSIATQFPNNRNWLRLLIESGFNSRNVLIVSSRNLSKEDLEFVNENKLTIIKMDIIDEDIEGICDLVMERARKSSGFYISFDLDAIDPAYAPGVKDISCGGLTSRDAIYFIKRLNLLNNFRGADIVEIDYSKDKKYEHVTLKLGARILAEMI
jgi:agmatinase